jgi:hypothetical protein
MSLSEACGAHSKRYAEKRPRIFAEPRWLANLGFRDTSSAGNPPTTQGKRIRGEITSSKGQELITSSYNKQQGASFGSLGKQFGASFVSVQKATLGSGSLICLPPRSSEAWGFGVSNFAFRQWQPPFLRRGRCFLGLASCRFRKRR